MTFILGLFIGGVVGYVTAALMNIIDHDNGED